MVENKHKLFLCDRWYYLVEEQDEKLLYTSKIDDRYDGNLLEISKNLNEVQITIFSKNTVLGKLKINGINTNNMEFHYTQFECEKIKLDNSTYTNLLFELFVENNQKPTNNNIKILFNKKRKLNKMCYKEPKIPLNKKINLSDIDTESLIIKYVVELMQSFPSFIYKIKNQKLLTTSSLPIIEEKKVLELYIPQNIYVYDRNYTLVKSNDNSYTYENREDGISNLEINLDISKSSLLNMTLRTKRSSKSEYFEHIITMTQDEQKNVTTMYKNYKSLKVNINDTKVENTKIKVLAEFDANNQNQDNIIEIETDKKHYTLAVHPVFKRDYIDSDGTRYKISNSELAVFQNIISISPRILNHVEKSFFKEKELMKK